MHGARGADFKWVIGYAATGKLLRAVSGGAAASAGLGDSDSSDDAARDVEVLRDMEQLEQQEDFGEFVASLKDVEIKLEISTDMAGRQIQLYGEAVLSAVLSKLRPRGSRVIRSSTAFVSGLTRRR